VGLCTAAMNLRVRNSRSGNSDGRPCTFVAHSVFQPPRAESERGAPLVQIPANTWEDLEAPSETKESHIAVAFSFRHVGKATP
jgi:hypothetical protein